MSESTNGNQGRPQTIFCVIGTETNFMPYAMVVETLRKNAAEQAKGNLRLGPIFRQISDSFRDWAAIAEPGWRFHATEVSLCVIRLSAAPPAAWLSEEAQKKAQEQADQETASRFKLIQEP